MRYLLLFMIMITNIIVNAQEIDCNTSWEKKTDRFEKYVSYNLTRSITNIDINTDKLTYAHLRMLDTFALLAIGLSNNICVIKQTDAIFLFEDDSTETLVNNSKTNCEKQSIYFIPKNHMIFKKKIIAIRFKTSNLHYDLMIQKEKSDLIYQLLNCKLDFKY